MYGTYSRYICTVVSMLQSVVTIPYTYTQYRFKNHFYNIYIYI